MKNIKDKAQSSELSRDAQDKKLVMRVMALGLAMLLIAGLVASFVMGVG